MIQRIQTLLLLIAAICFTVACFMPVGTISTSEIYYVVTPWVLKENIPDGLVIYPTYFIGMLQAMLAIISLVAVFLYKKRTTQSKVCTAAIIINFVLIIVMLWVYPGSILPNKLPGMEMEYSLFALLSILPLICLYLANKYIIRDEKMVRAADRLR
ncbi:MAG: DUF4293 domain-containing protein [Bacteroidales bacterium]|jgi:hypothetical protein|nr:DUF4293 domain-containing protein [Bacteroidales bacterium]